MAIKRKSNLEAADNVGFNTDDLTINSLTMGGVVLGAGTAVAGAGLVVTALPVQSLIAAGTSTGLIYAGQRKAKGLPILPWIKAKDDEEVIDTAAETVTAESATA